MKETLFYCPVCGMKCDLTVPMESHDGMHYYFCSDQCRDTFIQHPKLYGTHRHSGDRCIKARYFRFAQPVSTNDQDGIRACVETLMGIESACFEEGLLRVTYDLLQVNATRIESAIEKAGFALEEGLMHRIRRELIQEQEETDLTNLEAGEAACCNRSPKGE